VFDGQLSNSGEKLRLATASGATIVEVTYSDKWHKSTDGDEHSLVIVNPAAERLSTRKAWRSSEREGGSPGKTETWPVLK